MIDIELAGVAVGGLVAGAAFARLAMRPYNHALYGATPAAQLETIDSAHVHEAGAFTKTGWSCACGLHMHSYIFAIKNSRKYRCVCGKVGNGKEWA